MSEWIVCKRCGKEFPSTYFAISRETGHRRDICKRCQSQTYNEDRRPIPKEDRERSTDARWKKKELDWIYEGARVSDIEKATGRTPNAIRKKANLRGFVIRNGKLVARNRLKPFKNKGMDTD